MAKENAELQASEKRIDRELVDTKSRAAVQLEKHKKEMKDLGATIAGLQKAAEEKKAQLQQAQQSLVTEKEMEKVSLKKDNARLRGAVEALEAELVRREEEAKILRCDQEKLKAGLEERQGELDATRGKLGDVGSLLKYRL